MKFLDQIVILFFITLKKKHSPVFHGGKFPFFSPGLDQENPSFLFWNLLSFFSVYLHFIAIAVLLSIHGHSPFLYCSWQVVTYLAGCGLQSCPMLLAKGYPDVGWNPIEGERYLSFLRFAVFVNSEFHVLHDRNSIIINYGFMHKRATFHCFLPVNIVDYKDGWQLARELPRRNRPDKHQENLMTDPARNSLHGLTCLLSVPLLLYLICFTELMSMQLPVFRVVYEWVRGWVDV